MDWGLCNDGTRFLKSDRIYLDQNGSLGSFHSKNGSRTVLDNERDEWLSWLFKLKEFGLVDGQHQWFLRA